MSGSSHDKGSMPNYGFSISQAHSDVIGLTLVIGSFVLLGWWSKIWKIDSSDKHKRFDLFKIPGIERTIKTPYFSFFFRLTPALLFIFIIATGLYGKTRSNLAAPFTWLFWWTLLVFFVAFGGKVFCAACPWDFFANLFQFGWFHKLRSKTQSMNIKWPKRLTNIYWAVGFFIVLTWLELGIQAAYSSYLTAILGLIVVGAAILFALVFEKRPFCRYLCPIGRISGIYAQFSPVELRVKNNEICQQCRTKECVKGGPVSTPCPTGLIPYQFKENTYCTLCTECIRSCEKNNLTLKIRPFGTDLAQAESSPGKLKSDEIAMVITITVLTFFHGLTMIPLWFTWTDFLETRFGFDKLTSFSFLLVVILGLIYFGYVGFSKFLDKKMRTQGIVSSSSLAFAFIPLVLGYHIGHNTMHFSGEGAYLLPLINDPFGWGWNLFGFQDFKAAPMLSHSVVRLIQLLSIAIGFYYSVKILRIRSNKISKTIGGTASVSQILFGSHYLIIFILGLLGLWFVYQPMVMRSTY